MRWHMAMGLALLLMAALLSVQVMPAEQHLNA